MSASICTDCLARLRISKSPVGVTSLTKTHVSAFHSSPAQYKSPLLKKKVLDPNKSVVMRKATGVRLKKNVRDKPNIAPVGERRTARKRIVLSNTNALEVNGMETLSAESMGQEASLGKVMALPGELLDQLRDCQAFKTTQNWNMFRRPATMIRAETLDIAKNVEEVDKRQGKNFKYLVTGEKGSGKSILALQAMSMAFMKQWVVLNIPEGHELTNNTSFYAPARKSATQVEGSQPEEQLYNQSHLAQALLKRAAYANEMVLSTLKLNHIEEHLKDYPKLRIKPNATLRDIALIGTEDATLAVSAWKVFWKELNTAGNNPRPPLLISVDGADHWFGLTKYRNAEFELIHAQQFTLIKQLTDLLFSSPQSPAPLLNGGLILFTTSGSNSPNFPSFEALIEQIQATKQGINPKSPDFPLQDPYSKPDTRVTSLLERAADVNVLDVNGTSKFESKGILEYFAKSGLLQKPLSERLVQDYRQLSAGGIIGELARLGARVRA